MKNNVSHILGAGGSMRKLSPEAKTIEVRERYNDAFDRYEQASVIQLCSSRWCRLLRRIFNWRT